jgi:ribonuclease HII
MTFSLTCGIDEAGRGPLAGPVTAAAVCFPAGLSVPGLGDSKALSPSRRERLAVLIRETAIDWAVGWAWPEEIDRYNIHRATLLAMRRALQGLVVKPTHLLVDGLFVPPCDIPAQAVVRGDATIPAIMAASILAKTERDTWMVRYAAIDPRYCFERHKGYPTRQHRESIVRHGLSAIHRRSFRSSACAGTPPPG